MARSMTELGLLLDSKGWTLTKAIDPVDSSEIVILDWQQVNGLVRDFEEQIATLTRTLDKVSLALAQARGEI